MEGYEVTIQLPPTPNRPRGLLVDAAFKITQDALTFQGRDRTGLGVQHIPWGCDPLWLGNADFCADDILVDAAGTPVEGDKEAAIASFPDLQVHPAFKLVDAISCSTMSFPDDTAENASMVNRLRNRLRTMASFYLARELATGAASGGWALVDGTDLGNPATMFEAASIIEEFLGDKLFNGQGTVHMSPALLHTAKYAGWVCVEPDGLYTTSGHRVAADAGYGVASGNTYRVYASGPIHYRISDLSLLGEGGQTIDYGNNIRTRFAEAWGQLAFDNCPVGFVDVPADSTPIS